MAIGDNDYVMTVISLIISHLTAAIKQTRPTARTRKAGPRRDFGAERPGAASAAWPLPQGGVWGGVGRPTESHRTYGMPGQNRA